MRLTVLMKMVLIAKSFYNFSAAVLMDLSEAYDTMNHELLMEMLHIYGIRGTYLKLSTWVTYINGIDMEEAISNAKMTLHYL